MAILANLARMTTATTGTGTITLGSAATGFLTFAAAGVANGITVSYAIEDGNDREVGRGVYTSSGTTLTRSVVNSTNGGAAISLSGSAEVFITGLAEDFEDLVVPDASQTDAGKIEIATDAEVQTGTDTVRAVTPAGLAARTATTTRTGVVELATDAETQTGTDTARAITPSNLSARTATTTRTGVVELATDAETQTGTDTARAITPSNLSARTATETRTGVVELATTAEASTGTDTARAVTPAGTKAHVDARIGTAAGNLVALDGSAKLPAVDGSQLTGLSAGSLTSIATINVTAVSAVSFTGIPATYRYLFIEINGVATASSSTLTVAVSANNGSSYGTAYNIRNNTTAARNGVLMIFNYSDTGKSKVIASLVNASTGSFAPDYYTEDVVTGVVNAVRFSNSGGFNFVAGSTIVLWGAK